MKKRNPYRATVTRFSSVAAFVKRSTSCAKIRALAENKPDKWAGGSIADALKFAKDGDLSAVAEVERIMSRIDDRVDSKCATPIWMPSVVGAFPLVPAYLAGTTPESMLSRNDVPDPRSDLEIWADTSASGNVSVRDMQRRGVVVLALAMTLSRIRNVRLVAYSSNEGANAAISLSVPIDISEACAVFCQPVFTRRLMYAYSESSYPYDGQLLWASWASVKAGDEAERTALESFGMPSDAVLLPCQKIGSFAKLSDDDLIHILNSKLREYAGR